MREREREKTLLNKQFRLTFVDSCSLDDESNKVLPSRVETIKFRAIALGMNSITHRHKTVFLTFALQRFSFFFKIWFHKME